MKTTLFPNPPQPGKAWFRRFASPLFAGVAAVLVGTAGSVHAVNLVSNGDFSANAAAFVTSPGWIAGVGPTWASNPGIIADWDCDNYPANASLAINGPSVGFSPKFPNGPITEPNFNFVWMQWMTQNIYQILPLDPTTTYQVDLDAAAAAGQVGGKFQVNMRNATTVFWSSGDQVVSQNGFMHYTFTFTTPATLNSPNIQLLITGSIAGDGIDFANVSVQVGTPVIVPPGPTNLIANGDFMANAAAFVGNNGILGGGNPATITSWTAGAGNIGLNGPATSAGSAYAPLNGDGGYTYAFSSWGSAFSSLSQTLSGDYTPNTQYELSFDAGQFRWAPSTAFSVSISDNTQTHVTTGNLNSTPLTSFTHFSYTFTSPATFDGPCVIKLLNADAVTGAGGVDFANVSLRLPTPLPPPTLIMTKSGPNLQFNWSSGAILLQATDVAGPWTTNSTTSPNLVIPVGGQMFFRAMRP